MEIRSLERYIRKDVEISMDNCLTSKRVGWIDALRAFAIILVIIGHANKVPGLLKNIIYSFHVPLFFFLAGYLFHWEKYEDLSSFVQAKFKQYMIPYFALGLVNLILNAIRESLSMSGKELLISTIKHFLWLIYSYSTAQKMPNCTPLWFLPCLFLSTIFLYCFFQCLRKMPDKHIYIHICAISIVIAGIYIMKTRKDVLPWHIDVAILGSFLMLVGYLWREKRVIEKVPFAGSFTLLVIGVGTSYMNNGAALASSSIHDPVLFFIGTTSTCMACFVLFQRFYRIRLQFVEYVGRNTAIIMGFNYVAKTFANYIWENASIVDGLKLSWYVQCVIVFLLCLMAMVVWSALKKLFPKIAVF